MAINNILVGTTNTDIYTSAAASAVTVIYLCNTHTADVIVNVSILPAGDTLGLEHRVYHDITIPAGDTYIIDSERLLMEAGDKIVADASVDVVVAATTSYTEV